MAFSDPTSRLILALDAPNIADAERLVEATAGMVGVYKVGLELAMAGGLELARRLASDGMHVFLDMKLLDIPNTVAGAVRGAGALGVRYLTVHAYPQALRAAASARPPGLQIVAVTVLTSLDDKDLLETGYPSGMQDLTASRIAAAARAGVQAIVCSPQEAGAARATGLTVITPGVRLTEDAAGDQKRVETPERAIAAGADAVVVGRPINAAKDPREAAKRYVASIEAGLMERSYAL
ncbi:MAG: orotidine-5'-phosphate decarboxylase [Pseudomonadota bacterium]